jgi:hypothetical protein
LGFVVLGRLGDKSSNANTGFIARRQDEWDWLRSFLSLAKLMELLGKDYTGRLIECFEMSTEGSRRTACRGSLGWGCRCRRRCRYCRHCCRRPGRSVARCLQAVEARCDIHVAVAGAGVVAETSAGWGSSGCRSSGSSGRHRCRGCRRFCAGPGPPSLLSSPASTRPASCATRSSRFPEINMSSQSSIA